MKTARSGHERFELAWLRTADAALRQDGAARGLAMRGLSAADDVGATASPALSEDETQHYQHTVLAAAGTLWQTLRAEGIERLHWFVNGDLHAVPWPVVLGPVLRQHGLDLRCYPHSAAWLRSMEAEGASAPATGGAWLMHDPVEMQGDLPCLPLERAMGQHWWARAGRRAVDVPPQRPQWASSEGATPVQALFVLAHGAAPQGQTSGIDELKVAQAVIVLGCRDDGQARHFTAAQLRGIEHARRVVINSCITGRSQEVLSETLGLLASAFDQQAHCVVGAMVRVSDWEAMLIGCAFHHALSQPEAQQDWVGSFYKLQAQVLAGHWPEGFVDDLHRGWLAWSRALQEQSSVQERQRIRYQLNVWLQAQGLQPLTRFTDDDWGGDWLQLADSVRSPSRQVQNTMAWYVAHGVG